MTTLDKNQRRPEKQTGAERQAVPCLLYHTEEKRRGKKPGYYLRELVLELLLTAPAESLELGDVRMMRIAAFKVGEGCFQLR